MKIRFLRFVATQHNPYGQPAGLFSVAFALLKSGRLLPEEKTALRQEMVWFEKNLPVPRPDYITSSHVFWYKAETHECLQRMWGLANVLKAHGYLVDVQRCQWPGHVVYEDAFQVIATPFKR
jgi:hypothetical protein